MNAVLLDGVGSTSYRVLLVVHILAFVAAFGPTLVYGLVSRTAADRGGEPGSAVAALGPLLNSRASLPALVVTAVAGMVLVVLSDGAWEFGSTWVSVAFTIVVLLLLVGWFVLGPALRSLETAVRDTASTGDTSGDKVRTARKMVALTTGAFHLGLVIVIVLMVWKPT